MKLKSIILITYITLIFFSCKKEEAKSVPSIIPWHINWISTEGTNFYDEQGRVIQLRGINQRIDGIFDVSFDDGRTANEIIPTFTQDDVRNIASMGFNFLRIPLSWSAFEPEKDQYDTSYFNRVKEVIQWCKQVNIYVQLDWHFDAWGKDIGEDGAPYWTMFVSPIPKWEGPIDFNQLYLRRANPFVFKCYQNLERNIRGLREDYMQIWEALIKTFKDEVTVIGFEPFNEPVFYAGGVSDARFMNLYEECSKRMRAIDDKHLLWLEPDAIRNFLNQSPIPSTPFIDDKIVYCPHYYPNLTLGVSYPTTAQWITATNKDFNRIAYEGKAWNAPTVLNEWGINPSTTAGKAMITAYVKQIEDRNLHAAFWLYKEPKPGTSGPDGTWGFFEDLGDGQNFSVRQEAIDNYVVPYAMALPGIYSEHSFNKTTKTLTIKFIGNKSKANPILFIPEYWYPNGFELYINNELITTMPDSYNRYNLNWFATYNQTYTLIVQPK